MDPEAFLCTELARLEQIVIKTLADELSNFRCALAAEHNDSDGHQTTNKMSRRSSSCGLRKRVVVEDAGTASVTPTRASIVDWVVLKPKTRNSNRPEMKLPVVSERELGIMTETEIHQRIESIPAGMRDDDDCSTQLSTQANALNYVRKYLRVTEQLMLQLREASN